MKNIFEKTIINKILVSSFFVFSLFLININNAGAQIYVSGPEINNLPLCDSTYKLNCPYNVRCRNINGMIAFACPASYANQPLNTNFNNNYVNNNSYNYTYQNNNQNYNYANTNYSYNNTNYSFVNSPVYFENGAYYTNPVIRPSYDLATTYNYTNYNY